MAALLVVAIALAVGREYFERSRIHSLELGEGVRARVLGRSRLEPVAGSAHNLKLWLDGEAVIDMPATATLTVGSMLLEVVVEGGDPARFYFDAHAGQAGAQVLVLRGHVQVSKAYDSPRPESYRLGPRRDAHGEPRYRFNGEREVHPGRAARLGARRRFLTFKIKTNEPAEIPIYPPVSRRVILLSWCGFPRSTTVSSVAFAASLRRTGRSREDSEDLIQEAMLRAARILQNRSSARSRGVLARTVRNLSIDWHRTAHSNLYSKKTLEELDATIALVDESPTPDVIFSSQDRLHRIGRKLEAISERTRDIYFAHRRRL